MPYGPGDAYGHTHKADTPKRDRQWRHVITSALERGKSHGAAIRMANGVVKKQVAHDKRAALLGSVHQALVHGGGETSRITIEEDGRVLLTKKDGGVFDVDEDRDPEVQKVGAFGAAIGSIGKGLLSAAKSPGVMKRVGIGAGIGAAGGAATAPKDGNVAGRAIGGALLGGVGGALTSPNFRSSAMRAIAGKPAGRVFAPGIPAVRPGAGTAMKAAPAAAAAQKAPGVKIGAGFGPLLRTPGLAGRALGGAAIGAAAGYATRGEGQDGAGRAIGGGLLGAAGGALTSRAFRGNLSRMAGGRPTHGSVSFSAARRPATPGGGGPSFGFRAGAAVRKAEHIPQAVATRVRHTRSDFAAARAGMSEGGAARRRAAVDAVARRQRHAKIVGPRVPVIGLDVPATGVRPGPLRVGANAGAGTPSGAVAKLDAAAEREAGRSAARRLGLER